MKNLIKNLLRENIELNDYKKWVMLNKEPVNIKTLRSLIGLKQEDLLNDDIKQRKLEMKKNILDFINNNINQNECFHNAGKTFDFLKANGYDVRFVLGIMFENGKIMGHAWNEIFGEHYDFTAEVSEPISNKYYSLFKFDNASEIRNLSVFNPNEVCDNKLTIDGENYDINGYCSILPQYKKLYS
tara:strand:+ start:39024 stop:39578 length:555 start_codon:yes stop_codon:yes gene_type:complete